MKRKKHRSQMDAIDEINMTPLIDLTFLLLIIFMITAPVMEYSVDVSTPKMNANTIDDEQQHNLSLNKDGSYLYNNEKFTIAELQVKLSEIFKTEPEAKFMVRGDGSRPYKEVINLLNLAKKCGFKKANLVTAAEEQN